jgi:hypothetical protein
MTSRWSRLLNLLNRLTRWLMSLNPNDLESALPRLVAQRQAWLAEQADLSRTAQADRELGVLFARSWAVGYARYSELEQLSRREGSRMWLAATIEEVAKDLGMPLPAKGVYNDNFVNGFLETAKSMFEQVKSRGGDR